MQRTDTTTLSTTAHQPTQTRIGATLTSIVSGIRSALFGTKSQPKEVPVTAVAPFPVELHVTVPTHFDVDLDNPEDEPEIEKTSPTTYVFFTGRPDSSNSTLSDLPAESKTSTPTPAIIRRAPTVSL